METEWSATEEEERHQEPSLPGICDDDFEVLDGPREQELKVSSFFLRPTAH